MRPATRLLAVLTIILLGSQDNLYAQNFKEGEVLVKFRDIGQAFHPSNVQVTKVGSFDHNWYKVKSQVNSTGELIDFYKNRSFVEFVEPNGIVTVQETVPNDPLLPDLWGMDKIQATRAWDYHTDSSDVFAVIQDTGVTFDHPDLAGNLVREYSVTVNTDGTISPGGEETFYHGTHVVGTMAAVGNNDIGVVGVNWQARVISVASLPFGVGSWEQQIAGWDYITDLKLKHGLDIRIVNNSWGGSFYSQALYEAGARARDAGILHVCAAGNEGNNSELKPLYPAAFDHPNIISVAATDQLDEMALFTNYGLCAVDLGGPGVGILSTVPDLGGDEYFYFSGTSMASPHVAGVALALMSRNPGWTWEQVKDQILASVDRILPAGHFRSTVTNGRLNFYKAVAETFGPNQAPQVLLSSERKVMFPGDKFWLTAETTDPDGDELRLGWFDPSRSLFVQEYESHRVLVEVPEFWSKREPGVFTFRFGASDNREATCPEIQVEFRPSR